MINPIIRIHNVETDEVIDREMTNAEYEVYLADKEQETKKIADSQKALADKEAARQAVYAKLGLTADEIAALV